MNTITTYKFSDLPTQELKDKAIERHRDWNTDHDWWEYTYSDWKEKLEALGYSDPEIRFSGFHSQGDGACFTCKQVPLPSTDPKVIEAWDQLVGAAGLIGESIREDINDQAFGSVIRTSHHYSHENTVSVGWEWNDPLFYHRTTPDGMLPLVRALRMAIHTYFDNLEDVVKDLCREIYSDLENEYEYRTSDEGVAESLESNEVEFEVDEEGELV